MKYTFKIKISQKLVKLQNMLLKILMQLFFSRLNKNEEKSEYQRENKGFRAHANKVFS